MTLSRAFLIALLLTIAGLVMHSCVLDTRLKAAVSDRDRLNGAVEQQAREAKAKLKDLTAERDARQVLLDNARKAQELSDATSAATIATQARRLTALSVAGGGRLRDPYAAAGCGGGGPKGPDSAGAPAGEGHAGQTPGALSEQLSKFLVDQFRSADEVNAAYASCREDAFSLRSLLGEPALP